MSKLIKPDLSDKRAELYYTKDAWLKQMTLVMGFQKEIAWHGVVTRLPDEGVNAYLVSDIVVYPQTVTSSYIDMDTEGYAEWLREHMDDERFYNMKMQGHSHVNMGVSPSGVDLRHQKMQLAKEPSDGFYIFIIQNKDLDYNIWIYDFRDNILFESEDVEILFEDGKSVTEPISEALYVLESSCAKNDINHHLYNETEAELCY